MMEEEGCEKRRGAERWLLCVLLLCSSIARVCRAGEQRQQQQLCASEPVEDVSTSSDLLLECNSVPDRLSYAWFTTHSLSDDGCSDFPLAPYAACQDMDYCRLSDVSLSVAEMDFCCGSEDASSLYKCFRIALCSENVTSMELVSGGDGSGSAYRGHTATLDVRIVLDPHPSKQYPTASIGGHSINVEVVTADPVVTSEHLLYRYSFEVPEEEGTMDAQQIAFNVAYTTNVEDCPVVLGELRIPLIASPPSPTSPSTTSTSSGPPHTTPTASASPPSTSAPEHSPPSPSTSPTSPTSPTAPPMAASPSSSTERQGRTLNQFEVGLIAVASVMFVILLVLAVACGVFFHTRSYLVLSSSWRKKHFSLKNRARYTEACVARQQNTPGHISFPEYATPTCIKESPVDSVDSFSVLISHSTADDGHEHRTHPLFDSEDRNTASL